MRRRLLSSTLIALFLLSPVVQAKLNDRQMMNCIYQHRKTQVAFLDLEQAYEMRSVSAKDFFMAIDRAQSCSQLRTNIKGLHSRVISALRGSRQSAQKLGSQSENSTVEDFPVMRGDTVGEF